MSDTGGVTIQRTDDGDTITVPVETYVRKASDFAVPQATVTVTRSRRKSELAELADLRREVGRLMDDNARLRRALAGGSD